MVKFNFGLGGSDDKKDDQTTGDAAQATQATDQAVATEEVVLEPTVKTEEPVAAPVAEETPATESAVTAEPIIEPTPITEEAVTPAEVTEAPAPEEKAEEETAAGIKNPFADVGAAPTVTAEPMTEAAEPVPPVVEEKEETLTEAPFAFGGGTEDEGAATAGQAATGTDPLATLSNVKAEIELFVEKRKTNIADYEAQVKELKDKIKDEERSLKEEQEEFAKMLQEMQSLTGSFEMSAKKSSSKSKKAA